jgi:hypothetical protein
MQATRRFRSKHHRSACLKLANSLHEVVEIDCELAVFWNHTNNLFLDIDSLLLDVLILDIRFQQCQP